MGYKSGGLIKSVSTLLTGTSMDYVPLEMPFLMVIGILSSRNQFMAENRGPQFLSNFFLAPVASHWKALR